MGQHKFGPWLVEKGVRCNNPRFDGVPGHPRIPQDKSSSGHP